MTACALLLCALLAQQPLRFGERVDVEVVDLEVVAFDRHDEPVTDLARSDFTVLVNGEPAEIVDFAAHFGAVPETALPATIARDDAPASPVVDPQHSRVWLVFADMLRVNEFRRMVGIRAIRDFLESSARPADRIMVASFDGAALRIVQPLTENHRAASKALQSLMARTVPSRLNFGGLTLDEEDLVRTERAAMHALRDYVAIASGVPGRRLLLMVGGGYRLHGWENLERAARLQTDYEELRDALAGSDITMYGVFGEGKSLLAFGADMPVEFEPGIDGPAPEMSQIPMGGTVHTLARDSGGQPFVATSGLHRRLDLAQRRRDGHYALAFRSPATSAGKRLHVRVRVAREGVRVLHRRLVRIATDAENAKKTSMAALLTDRPDNPWNVRVSAGRVTRDRLWRFRAPIEIRVPVDPLLFVEKDGRDTAHLQFFVSVRDSRGNYTSGDPKELKLALSTAELDALRQRGIRYRLELLVSPGTTDISVTVADILARAHSTARFAVSAGSRSPRSDRE